MSIATTAAAVLFPALLWGAYHHYRDRRRPEPVSHSLLAVGAGIGAGALGQALYRALEWAGLWRDAYSLAEQDLVALLVYSVLGIGLIEELAKLLPFIAFARLLTHFDEPADGIIYAGLIAVGFAIYENVFYLEFASEAETSRARSRDRSCTWCLRRFGDIRPASRSSRAAAVVHGVYDFCVIGLPAWARVLPALIVVAVWLRKVRLIEYVLTETPRR